MLLTPQTYLTAGLRGMPPRAHLSSGWRCSAELCTHCHKPSSTKRQRNKQIQSQKKSRPKSETLQDVGAVFDSAITFSWNLLDHCSAGCLVLSSGCDTIAGYCTCSFTEAISQLIMRLCDCRKHPNRTFWMGSMLCLTVIEILFQENVKTR